MNTTHYYDQAGEYTVVVTFKDIDNITHRTVRRIRVGSVLQATLNVSTELYYGVSADGEIPIEEPDGVGGDYAYVYAFSNVDGGVAPFTYKWEKIEGGSTELLPETGTSLLLGSRLSTTTGTAFTIKLTVTDANGINTVVQRQINNVE